MSRGVHFPLGVARRLGVAPQTAALLVWLGAFGLMIGLWLAGLIPRNSYGVYARAGHHWLAGAPLYDTSNIEGFQYFPQSALLVAPLSALGATAGNILWRAAGWAMLAAGTYRLVKQLAPSASAECFLLATCMLVGVATGPLGNGQANLQLAGFILLVAADVAAGRWWRAAVLAVVGLALKPLMAVLLLLIWGLYRPTRWRIPLALAAAVAAPFALGDSAYVIAQYADCLHKLAVSAAPGPYYEDFRGLLATAGWVVPTRAALVIRGLAALAVLGVCWRVRRVFREPHAAALIAAFGGGYLMLFNPRTQSTSYVIPGAFVAVFGAVYLSEGQTQDFLAMLAIEALMTMNYHVLPFIELWLKPLACALFLAFLVRQALSPRPGWARPRSPAAP